MAEAVCLLRVQLSQSARRIGATTGQIDHISGVEICSQARGDLLAGVQRIRKLEAARRPGYSSGYHRRLPAFPADLTR